MTTHKSFIKIVPRATQLFIFNTFAVLAALTLVMPVNTILFAPYVFAEEHDENGDDGKNGDKGKNGDNGDHEESSLGSISGYKWEDVDGNGERDDGEPGLSGWIIELDNGMSTTTDPNGYYEFSGLEEDDYAVCERLQDNWIETYPHEDADDVTECEDEDEEFGPWGYEVDIEEGDLVSGLNFGNFKEGHISGHKYDALTEEPIEDWRIHVIYPNGRTYHRTTDGNGYYYFGDLGPGVYTVCEHMNEDDECMRHPSQVRPEEFYEIQMSSGAEGLNNPHYDFWNREIVVEAFKFYDLNKNGGWDRQDLNENSRWDWGEGELPLAGWTLCLYGEGEYFISPESCQLTDGKGYVKWNASPGSYRVLERMSEEQENEDWEQTAPPEEAFYYVDIAEDGGVIYWYWVDENQEERRETEAAYFGNWTEAGAIHASKWLAPFPVFSEEGRFFLDGGKVLFSGEEGEVPLRPYAGWDLCLSRQVTWDESGVWEDLDCELTNQKGLVWWMDLPPGNYRVEERLPERLARWWHVLSETVREVFLKTGERIEDIFFVNFSDDLEPPQSAFDDPQNPLFMRPPRFELASSTKPLDHVIIDTEMVELSLSGNSRDNVSGVASTTLTVWRVGNQDSVNNFPANSFFDVFVELDCTKTVKRETPPLAPLEDIIPIEIVPLSLTSVEPLMVTWGHDFKPSVAGPGVYCFEAKAKDNAENIEQTAIAGPIAYVPTPKISEEETAGVTETSFTVTWTTAHSATSRVIYDTVSHEALGEPPNYGYAFSTPETDTDPRVTSHSIIVGGLSPDATYYYRTVSVGSPVAVGPQGSVTTGSSPPPPPQSSPPSPGGGGGGGWTPPSPTEPEGGFKFFITPDVTMTGFVTLNFDGGPDATQIAIADNPGFAPATYVQYSTSTAWTLTGAFGEKTLYVKFSNRYVQYSKVLSDTVMYAPTESIEEQSEIAPAVIEPPKFLQEISAVAENESPATSENRQVVPSENESVASLEEGTAISPEPTSALQPKAPAFLWASAGSVIMLGTQSVTVGVLVAGAIPALMGYALYVTIRKTRRNLRRE